MESTVTKAMVPCYFGDRSSSDTVVRLRTSDGRDDWLYCHSHILIEKSKYFADRLSEKWPTCQILDSRNCVEVYCQESDFDSHVNALRLFYVKENSTDDIWHGVRNALNILRVAMELECPQIVTACVNYLEAVPWEETEEEEILKNIPGMGSQVMPILSRLEPVKPIAIMRIFRSAIQLATSSPSQDMNDLKTSAQEQLEYMLTEDDDEPLLKADDEIRSEVKQCMNRLFARFNCLLESLFCESLELASEPLRILQFYLSDLSWACQILTKLEIMRDLVICWMDASDKVLKIVHPSNTEPNHETIKMTLKIVEVAAKVLESIAYGNVILPASKRLHVVKVWLPFVRVAKPAIDSAVSSGDDAFELKVDGELWQSLESTFVSLVLTLPSGDQADILTEWLENNYIRYPDLSEAFDVWCYRSKVAKRRLAILEGNPGRSSMP